MGGHSEPKTDAEGITKIKSFQSVIEGAVGATGTFEVVSYTTQVVSGTNYRAKIRTGPGDTDYVHVTVYEPLPHTGEPASVLGEHTRTGVTLDAGF